MLKNFTSSFLCKLYFISTFRLSERHELNVNSKLATSLKYHYSLFQISEIFIKVANTIRVYVHNLKTNFVGKSASKI